MANLIIIWDEDTDPQGNIQHIAEHGLLTGDVEYVLQRPKSKATSASSGRSLVFGFTPSGEYIAVVFEWLDADTIYPVTAYEVPEPK